MILLHSQGFCPFLDLYLCDAAEPWQLGSQDVATPMMQGIMDLHHYIFFFLVPIVVRLHFFRGLYHASYSSPREFVRCLGVVIFRLMIVTALMGYVPPWAQICLENLNFQVLQAGEGTRYLVSPFAPLIPPEKGSGSFTEMFSSLRGTSQVSGTTGASAEGRDPFWKRIVLSLAGGSAKGACESCVGNLWDLFD
ncbi:hypothetical protein QYE76_018916 [Lolium multiflorum]|uniref:Cytochrome b/b6 N-terminal region profile domain-containing protein n=1 Tax=Lolium multiflorum TaxID=4521 RepID=A0AAD8Q6G6_LOLMU|nr:hypothetical protein QYE76_018902 [Lolium multiflorum]KAK1596499.1 hypothetical protein QYE76_018916 [Lolium multiflorum]